MQNLSVNQAIVLLIFEAVGASMRDYSIFFKEIGLIILILFVLVFIFAIFYSLHLFIQLKRIFRAQSVGSVGYGVCGRFGLYSCLVSIILNNSMAVISNNASSAQILFAAEVFTRNDDLPVISFGLTRQILQICLCFAVLIPFGFQNQAKNLLCLGYIYIGIIVAFFIASMVNRVNTDLKPADFFFPKIKRDLNQVLSEFFLIFIAYSFQDAFFLVYRDLKQKEQTPFRTMILARRAGFYISVFYFLSFLIYNIFITLEINGPYGVMYVFTAYNGPLRILQGLFHCIMPFYVGRMHFIYFVNEIAHRQIEQKYKHSFFGRDTIDSKAQQIGVVLEMGDNKTEMEDQNKMFQQAEKSDNILNIKTDPSEREPSDAKQLHLEFMLSSKAQFFWSMFYYVAMLALSLTTPLFWDKNEHQKQNRTLLSCFSIFLSAIPSIYISFIFPSVCAFQFQCKEGGWGLILTSAFFVIGLVGLGFTVFALVDVFY